jgi:hypothetical protein
MRWLTMPSAATHKSGGAQLPPDVSADLRECLPGTEANVLMVVSLAAGNGMAVNVLFATVPSMGPKQSKR